MKLTTQDLLRVLKWSYVCDNELQMNSADYDLAMQIAVQVGNPILAEEYARKRLEELANEA
jgi:hypothetical protein